MKSNRFNFIFSKKDNVKIIFRAGIYLWAIISFSCLINNADMFWGTHTYFDRNHLSGFTILELFPVLYDHPFILPLSIIATAIAGLIKIKSSILSLFLYYLIFSADENAYVILDGGNNLSHLLFFYNILLFLDISRTSVVLRVLSNLSLSMIRCQIVIIYLVAGLTKVSGELWTKGVAIYYVLISESYSYNFLSKWIANTHEFYIVVPTYTVLVFQLLFPYLIWSTKKTVRNGLILTGVLIHLNISFIIGLFSFGLIMCVSYLSFLKESEAKMIIEAVSEKFAFIQKKIGAIKLLS